MSTSRDRILNRISGASGTSEHPGEAPLTRFKSDDLWSTFETYLNALGGRIITRDELDNWLEKRCFVESASAVILGIPVVSDDVWEVDAGISVAEFAVAETGTLVVTARAETARMSSLAPPVNIVLVRRSSIVGTLGEAVARIPATTSVLITGPSRTADIEGILVRGVHGPGELLVYVYE